MAGVDPFNLHPDNKLSPSKGALLIAEPFMADPYFQRTVVLMCEHDTTGSFGFILNKFVDVPLRELIEDWENNDYRVGLGGPVQASSLYFIHTLGDRIAGSQQVAKGLYMGGDFDAIKDGIENGIFSKDSVRFFVGYSGWSESQLEEELAQKSWYVCPIKDLDLMNTADDQLWKMALQSMGSAFAPLSHFPTDPKWN